ncbi:MAG: hypothetical protein AMJ90_09335 [candidate division Zixibacteria bacterium SM23_73_2]|nr:MAG: hypothetical protein AMJ90_09335 [candidate division Zixibacteria bacterium SM23_73_2]
MKKSKTLLVISILLVIGGLVRLAATQTLFEFFGMENLWSGEPFFIYIYKILGVFVIWTGIILFICSKDLIKYKSIIKGSILTLFLFSVVSLWTGFSVGLKLRYFLVDSFFSLFLIIILLVFQRNKNP